MAGRLEGKVAVVTGGASGIGRATAIRFAEEGASVVVADLNPTRGDETVQAVRRSGQEAVFVEVDTTSEEDNERMADIAVQTFGRLDILMAAAGISHAGYVSGGSDELPAGRGDSAPDREAAADAQMLNWERVLNVNLNGVMLSDRACGQRMVDLGNGGSIINVSSVMAKLPRAGGEAYCVSKVGVWMLTKCLALELVGQGIRVNAIGPGFIDTPMSDMLQNDETLNRWVMSMTPMKRWGEPVEIADAAVFLASDEASFFTGELLHPDGGLFTE